MMSKQAPTIFPPQLEAVIFDMDGLMIDTERIAQRAWQIAGREGGFEIDDETYILAVGRTRDDTKEIFQAKYGEGFPFDNLYERKQQIMYELIDTEGIPTKSGLFELYDLIDELGIAKAVATSTARPTAIKKLTIVKALDRFEVIVCGDEIENGKPEPDIFLEAAARLGVATKNSIAPQRCIVLEDSEAGIRAAHAAGMAPIMVPDMKQPSAEVADLADHVLDSLWAVQPLLRAAVRLDADSLWAVWRQDIHGNSFKMREGLSQEAAAAIAAEYEAKGHKQHYWIKLDTGKL